MCIHVHVLRRYGRRVENGPSRTAGFVGPKKSTTSVLVHHDSNIGMVAGLASDHQNRLVIHGSPCLCACYLRKPILTVNHCPLGLEWAQRWRNQGYCAIWDIRPKLILNSNLTKSRPSVTSFSIIQSL